MLNRHNYMKGYLASKSDLITTGQSTYILFNIAETRSFKNKETGEYERNTQYFPFIAFSNTAEYINQHIQQHQHLLVDYRLDIQKVTVIDKVQSIIRLTAQSIEPLESKEIAKIRKNRFLEKSKLQEESKENDQVYEFNEDISEFVTAKKKEEKDYNDFAF